MKLKSQSDQKRCAYNGEFYRRLRKLYDDDWHDQLQVQAQQQEFIKMDQLVHDRGSVLQQLLQEFAGSELKNLRERDDISLINGLLTEQVLRQMGVQQQLIKVILKHTPETQFSLDSNLILEMSRRILAMFTPRESLESRLKLQKEQEPFFLAGHK